MDILDLIVVWLSVKHRRLLGGGGAQKETGEIPSQNFKNQYGGGGITVQTYFSKVVP